MLFYEEVALHRIAFLPLRSVVYLFHYSAIVVRVVPVFHAEPLVLVLDVIYESSWQKRSILKIPYPKHRWALLGSDYGHRYTPLVALLNSPTRNPQYLGQAKNPAPAVESPASPDLHLPAPHLWIAIIILASADDRRFRHDTILHLGTAGWLFACTVRPVAPTLIAYRSVTCRKGLSSCWPSLRFWPSSIWQENS